MITTTNIIQSLEKYGFDTISGIPCSALSGVFSKINNSPYFTFIDSSHEGLALASLNGAHLAGKQTTILMQNSGVGNTINFLSSFSLIYKIPCLLIISNRIGSAMQPEHLIMGKKSDLLLQTIGIEGCHVNTDEELTDAIRTGRNYISHNSSYAIFLNSANIKREKESYLNDKITLVNNGPGLNNELLHYNNTFNKEDLPHIKESLSLIASSSFCKDAYVFTSLGMISRFYCQIVKENNWGKKNFYALGSMGFISSVALGFSLASLETMKSTKPTVVIEGDGSFLMHLGAAATIGIIRENHPFIHVIIDNEAFQSTGAQQNLSSKGLDISKIGKAMGYKTYKVNSKDGIKSVIIDIEKDIQAEKVEKPYLIHIKCKKEYGDNLPDRVTKHIPTEQIKDRFMELYKSNEFAES